MYPTSIPLQILCVTETLMTGFESSGEVDEYDFTEPYRKRRVFFDNDSNLRDDALCLKFSSLHEKK